MEAFDNCFGTLKTARLIGDLLIRVRLYFSAILCCVRIRVAVGLPGVASVSIEFLREERVLSVLRSNGYEARQTSFLYHSLVSFPFRGTKRLVSVKFCSLEGNLAGIFVSQVSPGIFVIKSK